MTRLGRNKCRSASERHLAESSDNKRVKTLRLAVDPGHLETEASRRALREAADILRSGGLAAFPTETVYGLGANALDGDAVARIFAAKQRPSWDPVIVHIADLSMLEGLVTAIPEPARKLIDRFWPGPMTLLLPRTAAIPDSVTAGRPLVGVRMPSHPAALELIRQAGVPIAAPSANRFGHTSPTTAAHVVTDLDGRIDAILDAGPAQHGVESTVLDPGRSPIVIYRPGAVTLAQIRATAGPAELFQKQEPLRDTPVEALPSPGVGLRHYAPKARLILVSVTDGALSEALAQAASGMNGERLGVMLPAEAERPAQALVVWRWGRWSHPEELASSLYAGLRELDLQGCSAILCPLPPAGGIGDALRDRLAKAGIGLEQSQGK